MSCSENINISKKIFVDEIAKTIERLFVSLDKSSHHFSLGQFNSYTNITINIYILRLLNFFNVQESTLVLSLIYLDRIRKRNIIHIDNRNFYKLFLIALTVACKFNEDMIYKNSFYSQAGGVSLKEFNNLEKIFLISVDYSLIVFRDEYENMLKKLIYKVI